MVEVLYDTLSRETVARDRVEMLQRDYGPPVGSLRAGVGRGLVRLGARLAGEEVRLVHALPPRRGRTSPGLDGRLGCRQALSRPAVRSR